MIRFLLYEYAIGHNQLNASGNSPLMWVIHNKHCEAVKEVLVFDYLLYIKEYTTVERKNKRTRGTWGKQIRLYKEFNKIDLLKKNEFDKSILSEAFKAQDENILHVVLSHECRVC
ncbi:hypothetical protein PCYB_003280 [Plasmodium cynomolgi strain B]|uniref:Uncharacterized protein n=1 Tax=Plasmodium cynomolgi (strain B) TaxID=1120755 RepID=K6UZZ9_PLACD|nr:hypothetical protein PCYB_003280 [Plasmodium cynomolgi strain B]GAB69579.1 hypothetical protein PCYB_003280 [Plasmodium cynomolgi strain B]